MKLSARMYRRARQVRDIEVIASGSPKKMARRVKNKYLGRKFFSRLNRW